MVVIYARGPSGNSLWEYAVARQWEPQVVGDADVVMRAVRARKVEIVLASGLNGLACSSSQLVRVLREFVSRKVTLIIPNQQINTSKVSSKVSLDTLDAIEEFKRAVAVESINAGLTAASDFRGRVGAARRRGPVEDARPHWSRYRQMNATGVVIIVAPHRYPGAVFAWIATAATLCHPPAGQDRIRKRGFLLLCYAVHPP